MNVTVCIGEEAEQSCFQVISWLLKNREVRGSSVLLKVQNFMTSADRQ